MTHIHKPPFLHYHPSDQPDDPQDRTATRRLTLIFAVLSIGIILGGAFYYMNFERHFRSEVERQLAAIAELKVNEIVQWRKERLADAGVLHNNAPFAALVKRLLENPQDTDADRQIKVWLGKFHSHYQYDRVFLLDATGAERLAVPGGTVRAASHLSKDMVPCLDSGQDRLTRVGRVATQSVELPLQSIVQEALALVAGQIAERRVNVVVTAETVFVTGDLPRLVAVFQNLVDNAVKFMGDQPSPMVEIGVASKAGEHVFFVRDNGIGIDSRHRHKLFGLFEKLMTASAGTGMGLALVKRIVEIHGGRIWVESEGVGKGSCFLFTLTGCCRPMA